MAKRSSLRKRYAASINTTTVPVLQADPRVQDYLDTLLMDVGLRQLETAEPDFREPPAALAAERLATSVQVRDVLLSQAEISALQMRPHPETWERQKISPTEQLLRPKILKAISPTPVTHTEPGRPSATALRQKPVWAEQVFSCLLFDVQGLSLAAPLHELGGICPLADRLQSVSGQADWFMGLLRWNGRNIRVVDTARFVMPERVADNTHRSAYQSIIMLSDSNWALAVDSAEQSLNLQPDDVRWRMSVGKRPWLAGTLVHRLCAMLDIGMLLDMLNACDSMHCGESIALRNELA